MKYWTETTFRTKTVREVDTGKRGNISSDTHGEDNGKSSVFINWWSAA